MTQRRHKPWELAHPIWLDGSGDEVPRTCDLVICPECLAVRYIGHAHVEERTFTRAGIFEQTAKGVFCPGCDQLLFDEQAWIEHRAAQKHYDDQVKHRKEAERSTHADPPKGAAARSNASADAAPKAASTVHATSAREASPKRLALGAGT